MIKDKNQKGVEKEKQGEEGEESELQKSLIWKCLKLSIKRGGRSKTCCGRGKNVLRTART